MTDIKKRKPILWLLIDLIGTLFLLAGMFKFLDFEVPFISDFFRPFSTTLLISVGVIITIASMALFILPIIKANKNQNQTDSSSAVDRTNR